MALVDRELDRYQVDMAALSEARLAEFGETRSLVWESFKSQTGGRGGVCNQDESSAQTLG